VTYEQKINAAVGYYNLGMVEESLGELNAIAESDRSRPEALALRVSVLMRMQSWEEAAQCGVALTRLLPGEPSPYLDVAFCLHELKHTREAREILLNGPDSLKGNPTYHYNMACYEAQLGDLSTARRYLDRAIAMDSQFAEFWIDDPDLKFLHAGNKKKA